MIRAKASLQVFRSSGVFFKQTAPNWIYDVFYHNSLVAMMCVGSRSCLFSCPWLCFVPQLPSWTLLLAVCAVGIGGTFQYGYNVSIINAPTQVKTHLLFTGLFPLWTKCAFAVIAVGTEAFFLSCEGILLIYHWFLVTPIRVSDKSAK